MHRLDTARPQHIHAVRAVQRTAMNFHVGVDYDFGNDHRANAAHPLDEGERLWITQQVDVRLVAAQRGEAVEAVRGRPYTRIGRFRDTLDCHRSAFLTMSRDKTLRQDNSPGTLDMPLRPGRQVIRSELAGRRRTPRLARRCDVPRWRLSAEAVMLDSWQRFV